MRVRIHKLFEIFLQAHAARPEASLVHSLTQSPCLEDTSEKMNIMGETIADIALGEHRFAESIAKARQAGEENMNLINDFIQSHAELSWVRPQAGLIGFCRFNSDLDAAEISERLLAAPYRSFVMPGNAYGYSNHIRVGAGGAIAIPLKCGESMLLRPRPLRETPPELCLMLTDCRID